MAHPRSALRPALSPTASRPLAARGFALLVTIVLLAFLVLILVALASFTRVETQVAANAQTLSLARQNALLGLNIALGRLQETAGPDQRTTATADILDETGIDPGISATVATLPANRHWTGVWDSAIARTIPATSPSERGTHIPNPAFASFTGDTAKRKAKPLAWLLSGLPDPADGSAPASVSTPSLDATTLSLSAADTAAGWIVLVGKNSALDTTTPATLAATLPNAVVVRSEPILAPAPGLPDDTTTGRFAWWVGDEGIKAKLTLAEPDSHLGAFPSDRDLLLLTSASRTGFNLLTGFTADPADPAVRDALRRIIDPAQVGFATLADPPAFRRSFHDLTTHSHGLFTDSRHGGLRQDLSVYFREGASSGLSDSTLLFSDTRFGSDAFRASFPDLNYDYSPTYTTSAHIRATQLLAAHNLPRLGHLRSWANLASAPTPQPHQSLGTAPTHAKHPVLLRVQLPVGFMPKSNRSADVAAFPAFILWNPYNTPLPSSTYHVAINLLANPINLRAVTTPANRAYGPATSGNTEPSPPAPPQLRTIISSANASAAIPAPRSFDGSPLFTNPAEHRSSVYLACTTSFAPGETKVFTVQTLAAYASPPLVAVEQYVTPYTENGGLLFPYDDPLVTDAWQDGDAVRMSSIHNTQPRAWLLDASHLLLQAITINESVTGGNNPLQSEAINALSHVNQQFLRGTRMGENGLMLLRGVGDNLNNRHHRRMIPRAWTTFNPRASSVKNTLLRSGAFNNNSNLWHYSQTLEASRSQAYGADINPNDGTDGTSMEIALATDGGYAFFNPHSYGPQLTGSSGAYPAFDVPASSSDVLSLGRLQHAQITPGVSSPAYAVGNSYIPAWLRSESYAGHHDQSASAISPGSSFDPHQLGDANFHNSLLDFSLLANEALLDRFFLGVAPASASSGAPLPNPRLRLAPYQESEYSALPSPAERLRRGAAHLWNDGAFNINSTSVDAWTALLAGLRDLPVNNDTDSTLRTPYPRTLRPDGGDGALLTTASLPARGLSQKADAYTGYRALSDDDLRLLASRIVDEVRLRGPFLSLADFANRRLVSAADDLPDPRRTGVRGALQSALDRASLDLSANPSARFNGPFLQGDGTHFAADDATLHIPIPYTQDASATYPRHHLPSAALGEARYFTAAGLPGFLTQADLLQALAPALASRSDTFRIRAYGEVLDPVNSTATAPVVLARAWCEAVVQRTYEPVAPADDVAAPAGPFGRRFTIVSFRWLGPEDI